VSSTFERAVEAYQNSYADALRVFEERQRKYGVGNINAFRELGIIVRLSDKVERLKQLQRTGEEANDESLYDTFLDIANYGLIAMAVMRDEWPGDC